MSKLEEIGILHYDVPTGLQNFYFRLQKVLRGGRALQASKSVYLVNWADMPKIQGLVDGATKDFLEKYPEGAAKLTGLRISFLKFDDVTAEEAHAMAVEGLSRLISEVGTALKARLAKMKERNEDELPRRIKRLFAKRLLECEELAVAFRLMEDIEVGLEVLKKAVVAEVGTEVYTSVASGTRKKPERKKAKGKDGAKAKEKAEEPKEAEKSDGAKSDAKDEKGEKAESEQDTGEAEKKEEKPRVSAMFAQNSSR